MPKKRVYLIGFTILTLALIGSYFALLKDTAKRSKLTHEAVATITGTDVRRAANPETGQEYSVDVVVSFKYEINGTRYERSVRKSKVESLAFTPWGDAKICYDPDDPSTIENAELFPTDHRCG